MADPRTIVRHTAPGQPVAMVVEWSPSPPGTGSKVTRQLKIGLSGSTDAHTRSILLDRHHKGFGDFRHWEAIAEAAPALEALLSDVRWIAKLVEWRLPGDLRDHGVGRVMLEETLSRLSADGPTLVLLEVVPSDRPSARAQGRLVETYARHGFEIIPGMDGVSEPATSEDDHPWMWARLDG
jgi:hypothetical protein